MACQSGGDHHRAQRGTQPGDARTDRDLHRDGDVGGRRLHRHVEFFDGTTSLGMSPLMGGMGTASIGAVPQTYSS
jgi:hypothetical protein